MKYLKRFNESDWDNIGKRTPHISHHFLSKTLSDIIGVSTTEISDRIDEFEVIKNGNIDYISLNSLLDFYNIKYTKSEFIKHYNDNIKSLMNKPQVKLLKSEVSNMLLHESVTSSYSEETTGLEFIIGYDNTGCLVPDMIYKNEEAVHGLWLNTNTVIEIAVQHWSDRLRKGYKLLIHSYKERTLNSKKEVNGTPDVTWSIDVISEKPLTFK